MNCSRTGRLLPLFAGGDLHERSARRVREHLAACASCRAELEAYRTALKMVTAAVREATAADWTPSEWRTVLDRIVGERPAMRGPAVAAAARTPKWIPACAAGAAVFLVVAVGLLIRESPLTPAGNRPEPMFGAATPQGRESGKSLLGLAEQGIASQPSASRRGGPAAAAPASPAQDVISMTLVSPDTGLQVVWVFNRNFDWKGEPN